jgi:hypothetical protein
VFQAIILISRRLSHRYLILKVNEGKPHYRFRLAARFGQCVSQQTNSKVVVAYETLERFEGALNWRFTWLLAIKKGMELILNVSGTWHDLHE